MTGGKSQGLYNIDPSAKMDRKVQRGSQTRKHKVIDISLVWWGWWGGRMRGGKKVCVKCSDTDKI